MKPLDVGAELHAELDRARIAVAPDAGGPCDGDHRSSTGRSARPAPTVTVMPADGHLEVAAVVDGAAEEGDAAGGAGLPREGPVSRPSRALPGRAAVGRDLDAADRRRPPSAAVPVIVTYVFAGTPAPFAGDVIVEVGATVSVDAVRRDQARPGASAAGRPCRRTG